MEVVPETPVVAPPNDTALPPPASTNSTSPSLLAPLNPSPPPPSSLDSSLPPPVSSPPPPSIPSAIYPPPPPPSTPSDTPILSPPPISNNASSPLPPAMSPPSLLPPPPRNVTLPISGFPGKSPPSHISPPPKGSGDSLSPPGSHHVNLPLIAGVAAAIGMLVVMLIIGFACCAKKRKKKKPRSSMRYYADSACKGSGFYSSGQPSEWQNDPQTMDHIVKVPQSPVSLGPPGGGWHQPPASLISSGDMSSAPYSGPGIPLFPPPSPTMALGFNSRTFTYEELVSATNNFAEVNLLGQGGFGYVHKGVLPNGKEIAVKQLKAGSGQGEREFQAEVDIISRVHHRHLVSLVGYCIAGAKRVLVYDFVPNKTLEHHLHAKGVPPMNWPTRLKILIGSAKGLAYLHEDCHPRIIHRDIKSANILLDYKFEAMVADFGLAKLTSDNFTHVSTRVMGTFGYLAPEYASSGKLSEKSDVFSYGVMLLETITGRRPVDTHSFVEDSLVDWARPVLSRVLADGNYDDLADPRLDGNYDPMEMARMVACAAACVRHSARRRPKMSQIVRALEGDVSLEDLNEGMRPGQSMLFGSGSDYDSSAYTTNMRRIRRVALPSPEYSGEYTDTLPEYGLHGSSSSSDFSGELNPIGNQRNIPHLQL